MANKEEFIKIVSLYLALSEEGRRKAKEQGGPWTEFYEAIDAWMEKHKDDDGEGVRPIRTRNKTR